MTEIVDTHANDLANLASVSVSLPTVSTMSTVVSATVTNPVTGLSVAVIFPLLVY